MRRQPLRYCYAIRPRLEALEERLLLSAYAVTSSADDGSAGTLRYAINQANATGSTITEIDFNIGTVGSAQTINLASALPALNAPNAVYINGLSQGGSGNTTRLIELNGAGAGSGSDGLLLSGAGNTVSGLIIENFSANGIEVDGSGNTIGGTATGAGNVLSGNTNDGLLIDSAASGVLVQGNYIGTNTTGIAALSNSIGVEIAGNNNTVGGDVVSVSGTRNLISGNISDGVKIDSGASGNLVEGNNIGVNNYDNAALGNSNGIEVAGSNNTLGASYAVGPNEISGNSNDGVLLDSGSSANQVLGSYIGTNGAANAAMANKVGIEDAGSSNTIGGGVLGDKNVISGNSGDGVLIDPTASGETMQDNYIGLNLGGNALLANGGNGIEVQGLNNTNGGNSGTNVFTRNYISGNGTDGVLIDSGASGNQVVGNFIGVGVFGTNGVGNLTNGIEIAGSSDTIGGTISGYRNVISASGNDGILLDSTAADNLIQGNFVGTDYTGRVAMANSGNGIEVAGTGNTVGGTVSGARNIISGNSKDGVLIDSSASGTLVQGNYIGINYSSAALGNGTNGVEIAVSNNTVGGSVSGAGNTIADNSSGGVLVRAGSGNTIRQNSLFANGIANSGPGLTLDSGVNNNLAAPTLTAATLSGSTLTVTGSFTAPTANVSYGLDFFANPSYDAEGKIYLGSLTVTPTSTGTQNFTFTTTTTVVETDPLITATLTDASGDTSQIPPPDDDALTAVASLSVLDMNTGATVPANVPLNTFSTWSEDLSAQVSAATVSSYSWDVSQAPDLTNVSGTTTANLQGTWANFTGSARTDTITVTETPQSGSPLTQTITFLVAGTDSPAYSSSRPTSSSTWPTVITPDQITSGQAMQAAGPYAAIGEADGSVQTSFAMPSYNPNTTPVSLDYNSTVANAQPIFLDKYQLPLGRAVPATITAQLTFNNTALATVTYNTSALNAGDIVQIALQGNATGLSTGRYPWSITVTNGSNQTTESGNVDIVNQANSPYGAGWSLDNVEQLVSVSGGVMLVNPDGTSLFFASNGQGGYTTPAGDFSTLTLSNGVYTRTMPDGTQINFNSSGQETSSVDRDGNTTTFGYTSGLLTSITDMNGQVTALAYNASGLLSTITDPDNRTATLTYTGSQLTSITDPANDVWQYGYDSTNDLTALTDPNNNTTTFTYNTADRVASVTNADHTTDPASQLTAVQMNGWAAAGSSNVTAVLLAAGDQAQFADGNSNVWKTGLDWLGFGQTVLSADPLGDTSLIYRDANGLPWMSSDPLARRTREFFNSQGDPTKIVQPDDSYAQYQYNSFSEVTQYTDPSGDVTTYTYNSKGDLTQKEDALLNTWTYTYNSAGFVTSMEDPLLNTTSYGYNSLNELTSVTNALNQTVTYAYNNAGLVSSTTDAMGFTSTYSYDAMNRLTGKTLPDTSTTNSVYSYSYDKVGNQISVTDPLDHITTYTYNAVNEMTAMTNALNQTTTYGYDANGNQTSVTNPLNETTTNTYNAANELVGVTNALNYTYTYTYDAAGEETSVTNPLNQTTSYTYTLLGQVASATDPLNNTMDYSYNAAGDVTSITLAGTLQSPQVTSMTYNGVQEETSSTDPMNQTTGYQYDADGNLIGQTDPLNHTTTYTYNALNQLVSVTNALNQTTTYTYDADGNQTSVTNPLNQTTSYTYDAQGRILTQTAPNGGVTTYTYDAAGNLLSLTDPDDNTTSYSYNAVNEQVSMTNPMGYQSTYAYNAAGLLTSTTDADGRTIAYGYDAIGEKTSETWVGGNYTATYQYNGAGQLTEASDPFSTYTYTYDADGRETSVSNAGTPGVPTVTLDYIYDAYGNRTILSDSLGAWISYTYNAQNQVTGMSLWTGGPLMPVLSASVTFGYNAAGLLTGLTRGAGDTIVTSYSYDNANQLTNITDTDTTQSLTLANYTYGYNAAGELNSYQDNNNSSLSYTYDANGELTGASGTLNGSSYSVSYSYDANGNRNMTGYQTGTGNELLSDGTYSYTYDKDGNMLTQTNIATGSVTYYTWDYENRLIEVKEETSTGTVINDEKFTYDVNNNRIAVSLNGSPQLYTVYDGSNPYLDFNGSGTLTERYLENPNALSQFYGQVNGSGTVQWFLTDNINSIRQVISVSGSVLDAITYDPYGNILSQTNAANAPRLMYAGGAVNSLTGDYQFGRRDENPVDGRWLSQDSLGFRAGDTNLYRYVNNKPSYQIDPRGQATPSGSDIMDIQWKIHLIEVGWGGSKVPDSLWRLAQFGLDGGELAYYQRLQALLSLTKQIQSLMKQQATIAQKWYRAPTLESPGLMGGYSKQADAPPPPMPGYSMYEGLGKRIALYQALQASLLAGIAQFESNLNP